MLYRGPYNGNYAFNLPPPQTYTNVHSAARDASSIERLAKHCCCSCLKMRALVVCLSEIQEYIPEILQQACLYAVYC